MSKLPDGVIKLMHIIAEDWNVEESKLLGDASKERLRIILRIAADLDALFREENVIRKWLDTPVNNEGNVSNKELILSNDPYDLEKVAYWVSFISGRR